MNMHISYGGEGECGEVGEELLDSDLDILSVKKEP